jgi:hypothetical protein
MTVDQLLQLVIAESTGRARQPLVADIVEVRRA